MSIADGVHCAYGEEALESIAASWSTRSSITDLDRACVPSAGVGILDESALAGCNGSGTLLARFIGIRGAPDGSNPGAMRRSASRFRRSFSSSRAFSNASRRAACAANVARLELSTVNTCGSSVNG